jgi:hypothetical protein
MLAKEAGACGIRRCGGTQTVWDHTLFAVVNDLRAHECLALQ